ncbi:MAG: hypothetical protein KatS3mg082_1450 [Nitrospiraceae bacterium]|nr:MAG: hypothetical protein KatS3mg082_1450 [Nitrospiraceae bacterium]
MTRAVKRFETEAEALQALYKKGQGVVVMDHEVPVKCARYCGVRYCCPVGQEARNASSRYLVKALGVQVGPTGAPRPPVVA